GRPVGNKARSPAAAPGQDQTPPPGAADDDDVAAVPLGALSAPLSSRRFQRPGAHPAGRKSGSGGGGNYRAPGTRSLGRLSSGIDQIFTWWGLSRIQHRLPNEIGRAH